MTRVASLSASVPFVSLSRAWLLWWCYFFSWEPLLYLSHPAISFLRVEWTAKSSVAIRKCAICRSKPDLFIHPEMASEK